MHVEIQYKTERDIYLLIFFFFALIFLTSVSGFFDIPDAYPSFYTAKTIIADKKLDLDLTSDRDLALTGDTTTWKGIHIYSRGKDGKIYSKYGILVALYMIPYILLGRLIHLAVCPLLLVCMGELFFEKFAVSAMNVLPMAILCTMLARFARRMGFSFAVSFVLSVLLGVGTMIWHYAVSTFSEGLVTLEIFAAVYYIFKASQTNRRSDIAVSAIAAGAILLTKVVDFISFSVIAAYLVYVASKKGKREFITTFFSIIALFVAILFWLNYIRFGNVLETGYGQEIRGIPFIQSFIRLFYKIFRHLFTMEKGIFAYNPLLILTPFCLSAFYRRQRSLFYVFIGMSIVYLVGVSITRAALFESWGPRYFLPIVPFLVLPIGYLIERGGKVFRLAITFLFLVSFAVSLVSVLVSHSEYLYVKFLLGKKLPEDSRPFPSDLVGECVMLKHKLTKNDGTYDSRQFWLTKPPQAKPTINTYNYERFRGFNLWYRYLETRTGSRIFWAFPLISISLMALSGANILGLAKRPDKGSGSAGPSAKIS